MRSLLFTFILLFSFHYAFAAGTGKITGIVTDKTTNDILVGANIVIKGTTYGAAADFDGKYCLLNIPPGKYTLIFSYIGYVTLTKKDIEVKSNSETIVNAELVAEVISSEAIEVTAQAQGQLQSINQQKSSDKIKNTVSAEKIHELPDANSAAALSRLPGVSSSNQSNVVIRSIDARGYYNTEEYDRIYENEFLESTKNPLSTFSIDVDAASYSNIRRFLNNGQKPPKDAVRTEELINYFTYDYPQPKDKHPFSITTEVSRCPWNNDNKLVLIGLQGKKIENEDIPASNLVFLIDVSGSMAEPNKLPLVKSAFRLLVKQLRPDDRVAIVVYASNTGLVLPSTEGNEKEAILSAIDNLSAGGSTAGGAGIQLAYKVAKENFIKGGNNRVILATDGDFNVGISSTEELVQMIEEKRDQGIFLSVLGFGMGNYKDSKMERLADKGNGNYSYIDNILEAKKVFVGQMAGTLFTIAKDVKIQIEFNPSEVKAYRLIGYENRILNKEDFNDDKKDAGELGAGHTVTALYEIIPAGNRSGQPGVDPLKYQKEPEVSKSQYSDELLTVKFRYKKPNESESKLITKVLKDEDYSIDQASNNLMFACAVAEFGMLLRDSEFKGNSSYNDVIALAKKAKGDDDEGYRAEFIKLVESCELIAGK